ALRTAADAPGLPVQPARHDGRLEPALPRRQPLRAGPLALGAVEPRRLSGAGRGPLRRLPYAAQRARRGEIGTAPVPGRCTGGALGRACAQYAVLVSPAMDAPGHVRLPAHRVLGPPWRRRRPDGS